MKNNLDYPYLNILENILKNGIKKTDRTGTGTLSLFGTEIRHNMQDGFPLLTTKHVSFKNVASELLWFLSGDTNIKPLLKNNNKIWVGDAIKKYRKHEEEKLKKYLEANPDILVDFQQITEEEFIEKILTDEEFANKWGDLGKIYGYQWRSFESIKDYKTNLKCPLDGDDLYVQNIQFTDQISELINNLKTNPDSRRLMVTAWNPGNLSESILPPCHFGFQCYTRELTTSERFDILSKKYSELGLNHDRLDRQIEEETPSRGLSLKWHQRSCDFPLGVPYNIASYGLLLEMLAKKVNMLPENLIGTFGDTHIYLNQIDGVKEQLIREPYELPTLEISNKVVNDISEYELEDFKIIGYKNRGRIKFPLSN